MFKKKPKRAWNVLDFINPKDNAIKEDPMEIQRIIDETWPIIEEKEDEQIHLDDNDIDLDEEEDALWLVDALIVREGGKSSRNIATLSHQNITDIGDGDDDEEDEAEHKKYMESMEASDKIEFSKINEDDGIVIEGFASKRLAGYGWDEDDTIKIYKNKEDIKFKYALEQRYVVPIKLIRQNYDK